MKSLNEIKQLLAPELSELNAKIRKELTSGSPLMDKVVDTYLRGMGKQLRPVVLMLCARMFGPINPAVISSASAVEILHNASLIHDDIVDDSSLRRCRPTINSLWDSHVAVLVGDYFVSTAMQQAISTGNIGIIEALCHLGRLLSLGEIDEVYSSDISQFTEDSYFKIISYKTASLFVASARMGCFAQGLEDSDPRMAILARYAELLGLCFQIRDDIFDYLSDHDTIGKPTGSDIKEGKITLPLIYAMSKLGESERVLLTHEITADSLSEKRVAELAAFAVEGGGIDYAFDKMESLRKEAMEVLVPLPDSVYKDSLADLFSFTISRNF